MEERLDSGARVVAVVAHYKGGRAAIPTLKALLEQDQGLFGLVVVDDGGGGVEASEIESWLSTRPQKPWAAFIRKDSNDGPGSTFFTGIQEAIRRGAEACWLSDQDMVPNADCLRRLWNALAADPACSAAVPLRQNPEVGLQYRQYRLGPWGLVRVSSARTRFKGIAVFSGLLLRHPARALDFLPTDYFIDSDDFSFTWRLSLEQGPLLLVPEARAIHECGLVQKRWFGPIRIPVVLSPTWRLYYRSRNQWRFLSEMSSNRWQLLWLYARTFGPVVAAHVLYSGHPGEVLSLVRQGLRDGRRGVRGRRVFKDAVHVASKGR